MIFSKLFGLKKETNHKDNIAKKQSVGVKKKPLVDLSDAQLEKLLQEIKASDDQEFRNKSMAKINRFEPLLDLLNVKENQGAALEQIKRLVDEKVEPKENSYLAIFEALGSLNEQRKFIRNASENKGFSANVLQGESQKLTAALASWALNKDVRADAIQKVESLESVKFVIKNANDKQIVHLAKDKLDEAKKNKKLESEAIEQIEQILTAMAKLSRTEYDSVYSGRLHLLEKHWDNIDDQYKSAEHNEQYDAPYNICLGKIEENAQLEQENKLRAELLAEQQSCVKSVRQQMLTLSSDNVAEVKATFQKTIDTYNELKANPLSESRISEDFSHHEYHLSQLIKETENSATEILSTSSDLTEGEEEKDDSIDKSDELTKLEESLMRLKPLAAQYEKAEKYLQQSSEREYLSEDETVLPLAEVHKQSITELKKNIREIVKNSKNQVNYIDKKIIALKSQIRQKNLIKSNKLYHYLDNLVEELQGSFKEKERAKLDIALEQLNELRELHQFVTLPKKEALCSEMEGVPEENLEVDALQKRVKDIQKRWKSVMSSDAQADDVLWDRFNAASDEAFKPVRQHFDDLDALRNENLVKRQTICKDLETYLNTYDWSKPDWNEVQKKHQDVLTEWKEAFPVFFSENRKVQVEFDEVLAKLRAHLDKERQENIDIKASLVERAKSIATQLQESEIDTTKAIDQIKLLQSQWQTVGIVFISKDKKLWTEFRESCDLIFNHRRSEAQEHRKEVNEQLDEIDAVIQAIFDLTKLNDEDLVKEKENLVGLQSKAKELIAQQNEKLIELKSKKLSVAVDKVNIQLDGVSGRKQQQSTELLRKMADLCARAEMSLFNNGSTDELVHEINQTIDASEDASMYAPLMTRIEAIKSKAVASDQQGVEAAVKLIVLDLEIMFDIASPESEKSERMNYQLSKLKNGIQPKLQQDQKRAYLMEKELDFYRYHATQGHAQYQERLNKIIEKASKS